MAFSATEAAFEGFRLARRSPLTILIWAAAYIVFLLFFFALAGGSFIAVMAAANDLQGVTNPTPQDLEPVLAAYAGIAWIIPLSLALSTVLYTAALRAVLFPGESRFGYMRLGKDELRVFVVALVLGILAFAIYMAGAIIMGILAGVLGFVARDAGGAAFLPLILVFLALVGVMIWLAVRFSLALPITVAEKRLAIFDSWKLTKGHALGLFGMTLIIVVMGIVVSILAWLVLLPLIFLTGGIQAMAGMEGAGFGELMSAMGPAILVYVLCNSIISALSLAIFMAPYAAAYRDIRGGALAVS